MRAPQQPTPGLCGLGGSSIDLGYGVSVWQRSVSVAGAAVTPAAFGGVSWNASPGFQVAVLARLNDTTLETDPAQPAIPWALYPNPARNFATFQLPSVTSTVVRLTLLDALGRAVRSATVPVGASRYAFDLSGVPPGLYMVRVLGAGGPYAQRLMVE